MFASCSWSLLLGMGAETDMAAAADIPVAEDVDAVAVDAAGDLALASGPWPSAEPRPATGT